MGFRAFPAVRRSSLVRKQTEPFQKLGRERGAAPYAMGMAFCDPQSDLEGCLTIPGPRAHLAVLLEIT